MAQQTSVEFLAQKYYESEGKLTRNDFEQANEIHKKEITKTFEDASYYDAKSYNSADYYNMNYNQNPNRIVYTKIKDEFSVSSLSFFRHQYDTRLDCKEMSFEEWYQQIKKETMREKLLEYCYENEKDYLWNTSQREFDSLIELVNYGDITTFEQLANYGMETSFLKEQMNKNK
jgi:hypothetical protein